MFGCDRPAAVDGWCEECREDWVCRTEGCGELTDDGEGYDGFCGNCADRLESEGYWAHQD